MGQPPQADSGAVVPPGEEGDWLPIEVPGDINAMLVACGRMPDPHFDTQGRSCYWVTAQDWWYRLVFDAPAAHQADLLFEGIDGTADIWLNGDKLGRAANAFRPHRFDVSRLLRPSGNCLLVRFASIDGLLGGPRLDELRGWHERRTFLRKPQFNFGWDWALPLPSLGLSGPVRLEMDRSYRLVDVAVQTFTSGRVDFFFEVNKATRQAGYQIDLRLTGHGADLSRTIEPDAYKSYVSLMVPDPHLWWPSGIGPANLYDYSIDLRVGGQVVDRRAGRLGLRETRIVERPWPEAVGQGFSFEIEINGQPIFCKGGNWVPLELWPAMASDEQYRFYLNRAKEANFNMLRVWGGGIYEREIFYDLCDELGIMVWQDFMFASAGYPVSVLREEIIAEADYQVRRLRNRPSIVLWCGCNEDVYSWRHPNDRPAAEQSDDMGSDGSADCWKVDRLKEDPQLYSMILRGTVGLLGLGVPFVESSPASRDDCGNRPNSGNCHISAWKYALFQTNERYERFRDHFEQVCSFDSEFCDQGPCSVRAFRRFLAPENLWPPNDAWIYHIQRGHANLPHHEQTLRIAGAVFGPIDSLQTYVKHGQATHAEMIRGEFESARRDRPCNGGTMVWAYNDCWPTSNWSLIDYYRQPKPAYYAAKRACQPLLAMVVERAGQLGFFFGNDTLGPADVEVTYGQQTLDGRTVWSRNRSLRVPANSTLRFDAVPREPKAPTGEYFFIDAVVEGQALPRVIYFPDGWKGIDWPEPHLALEVLSQERTVRGWQTSIRLSTRRFARLAHVLYRGPQTNIWFSDNYFDLVGGASRDILLESADPIVVADLQPGHWLTDWQ